MGVDNGDESVPFSHSLYTMQLISRRKKSQQSLELLKKNMGCPTHSSGKSRELLHPSLSVMSGCHWLLLQGKDFPVGANETVGL